MQALLDRFPDRFLCQLRREATRFSTAACSPMSEVALLLVTGCRRLYTCSGRDLEGHAILIGGRQVLGLLPPGQAAALAAAVPSLTQLDATGRAAATWSVAFLRPNIAPTCCFRSTLHCRPGGHARLCGHARARGGRRRRGGALQPHPRGPPVRAAACGHHHGCGHHRHRQRVPLAGGWRLAARCSPLSPCVVRPQRCKPRPSHFSTRRRTW